MEAKIGDRVSLDAKKVGQPRRAGVVRGVTQGISGPRLEIAWEGGGVSIIAPGAGILLIEGRTKKATKAKAKAKAKAAKPKAKAKAAKPKAKAKAKAKAKSGKGSSGAKATRKAAKKAKKR